MISSVLKLVVCLFLSHQKPDFVMFGGDFNANYHRHQVVPSRIGVKH